METLRDCFINSFTRHAGKKALTFLRDGEIETELTYQALGRDSNRTANTLRGLDVEKGDRVILFLYRTPTPSWCFPALSRSL